MANLILPNGQTIQTDNPAEIAEFMARGAQDQSAAVAASPGQTIQQIASERGQAWNSQGGQGYLDAMRGGHNDPTSDPSNPQPFSAAAIMNQNNNGLLTQPRPGGGGLLGGGGSGSGYGGGSPVGRAPGAGGIYGSGGWTYGGFTPANPTIGGLASSPSTTAPQSFEDILNRYSQFNIYSAPLQNGTGFNWMMPQTTPGSVNIMDANLSRRYL
jgi:hypothetical protein